MLPFVLCILLLGWTLIALMYTPLNFYLAYRGVVGTRLYVLPQQFLAPPVGLLMLNRVALPLTAGLDAT